LDLLSKQRYSLSTLRCVSHTLHNEVGRYTGVETLYPFIILWVVDRTI